MQPLQAVDPQYAPLFNSTTPPENPYVMVVHDPNNFLKPSSPPMDMAQVRAAAARQWAAGKVVPEGGIPSGEYGQPVVYSPGVSGLGSILGLPTWALAVAGGVGAWYFIRKRR
jgi:hypothetical protein